MKQILTPGPKALAAGRIPRWIRGADLVGLRAAVRKDRGPAGAAVSASSVVADRNLVWPALAAVLILVPSPQQRRAGAAGLCAIAAQALVTRATKPLVGRSRPPGWQRVLARDVGRQPSSWSMPSSHAGNAVAFTAAASVQAPVLAVPLTLLAGVVSTSRLTTARHYPTDIAVGVLTGAAIGSTVGALLHRAFRHRERRRHPAPEGGHFRRSRGPAAALIMRTSLGDATVR